MPLFKVIWLIIIVYAASSCCHSKKIEKTKPSTPSQVNATEFVGYVSHAFLQDGCKTIVVIKNQNDSLVLIPIPDLPAEYDKDGLKIQFNYLPLRIQNPINCNMGIPAEIRDIE